MSYYVEWHSSIRTHFKTEDLMAALGITRREAVGIIGCLSAWAIEFRPGGIIERKRVGQAIEWERAENIVDVLITVGFLDVIDDETVAIHDWKEVTSGFRKARKDAARKKMQRSRVARQSTDCPRTVHGQSTERRGEQNRTEQNREEQSGEEKERGAAPDGAPVAAIAARALAERAVANWNNGRAAKDWIRVTPKRVAKAQARLKDGFTIDQLVDVVRKLKESEWHSGGNDRGWRAPGPEWVWHTTERVEEWIRRDGNQKGVGNGRHQGTQAVGEFKRPDGWFSKRAGLSGIPETQAGRDTGEDRSGAEGGEGGAAERTSA